MSCGTCAERGSLECSDCNPRLWFELACSCGNCGLRRDPLPEVPEIWLCSKCSGPCQVCVELQRAGMGDDIPCSICVQDVPRPSP